MDFTEVMTEDPRVPFLGLDDFLKGALEHDKPIGIDTEGTGLNILDGRDFSYGASIAYRHPHLGILSHYMPFRHPYGDNLPDNRFGQFKEILNQRAAEGRPFTSHNYTYDIAALESLGVDYTGAPGYCTLIGSQLINENWPFNKNLDNCGQHYLGYGKLKGPEGAWYYQTGIGLYNYARHDAKMHYELGEKVLPLMDKEGLLERVWPQKLKTIHVLNKMRRRGILIDQDLCKQQYELGVAIMGDIAETLGLNPGSPNDLHELFINRLGLPVVKWTDGGKSGKKKPSFDKEAMEEYDEILEHRDDPTAQLVAEYRGWQKATSACYRAYLDLVSPDGRLRTNYNLHRVKTGRLSSNSPNLQQIPRESTKPWHGSVKRAFVARPGYVLLEGDYSQLEFRLGAAYAKERRLLEVFNDVDRDVFDEMSVALGQPRQECKTQTYTTVYGGGIRRLMNVFNISEAEAYQRKNDFEVAYPNLKRAAKIAQQVAKRKKKVQLWTGRYRHFQYESEHHKAFNSYMQGGAADIVEFAMHRVNDELDTPGEFEMLLQIHDSIVAEVREDLVDKYAPEMKRVMENVTGPDGEDFGVKFKVDVHNFSKAA